MTSRPRAECAAETTFGRGRSSFPLLRRHAAGASPGPISFISPWGLNGASESHGPGEQICRSGRDAIYAVEKSEIGPPVRKRGRVLQNRKPEFGFFEKSAKRKSLARCGFRENEAKVLARNRLAFTPHPSVTEVCEKRGRRFPLPGEIGFFDISRKNRLLRGSEISGSTIARRGRQFL